MCGIRRHQLLAHLNKGYDIVRGIRAVPFGLDDLSRLAMATSVPLAPLLLTLFLQKSSLCGSSTSCSEDVAERIDLLHCFISEPDVSISLMTRLSVA